MNAAGLATLVALSSLAFLAAVAVAVRARPGGRAELLLTASIVANLLVLLPIHALGLANALTAASVALGSSFVSAGTLAATFVGEAPREHVRRTLRALGGIARLPWDALAEASRQRSVAALGVIATAWAIGFTLYMSYLLPSDGWDGIWYHELMSGYAIQQRGYRPIELPHTLIQQANGYPRNCEMTSLWFVIFTGQTLIEAVNSFVAVPLLMAVYLLARRLGGDRVGAMAWSVAYLWIPGTILQLRSNYMDVHVLTFACAALHYCTRPVLRVRDAWLAVVALALLIGGKSIALAWVPPLALIAVVRLAAQRGSERPRAVLATVIGGVAVIGASAALTYARNWIHFGNPLWPVGYTNAALGIAWPGVHDLHEMNWGRPAKEIFREIIRPPTPGHDFADTRVWGYGMAVPFVLLPLGAACGVALALWQIAAWLRRGLDAHADGDGGLAQRRANQALLIATPTLASLLLSPALWQARYNLHAVVGLIALVHWASGLRGGLRLSEGVAAFTLVANAISFSWCDPGWGLTVEQTLAFAKRPAHERITLAAAGWSIAPEVAAARERELGPGAVVVFTDDVTFPAVLWNDRYTNRLQYVAPQSSAEAMLARLDEIHAQWAVCGPTSQLCAAVTAHPERWSPIGLASRGFPTTAYRRVAAAAGGR